MGGPGLAGMRWGFRDWRGAEMELRAGPGEGVGPGEGGRA